MHYRSHRAWKVDASEYPTDGTPRERLTFLLSYAILAPSSHNSQPWRFEFTDDAVALYADRQRALPIVDAHSRELLISCGAALAQLQIALQRFGHAGDITLFPDGDQRDLLARVRLGPERAPTDDDQRLFAAIPERRTNRYPFASRALSMELLTDLQSLAQHEGAWLDIIQDADMRAQISDLIAAGDRLQWSDPSFRRELASWTRPNASQREDGIPGYALGINPVASLASALMIRAINLGKSQADKDRRLAAASPALVILGATADTPRDWLAAGQALARVLLHATADGVSASFLNQPIEVAALRDRLGNLLGHPGAPQVLLRLGYSGQRQPPRPTPRRPVAATTVAAPGGLQLASASSRRFSRRKALVGGGAGVLVLVAGGTVWRAADQGVFSTGQGPAYAPWYDWRASTSGPLSLVRAAILASNPHDSQPWLFRVGESRIDLYADISRRIGLADPFLSELHIGLGCALENIVLAAPAGGLSAQVRLFPSPSDATHVARVDVQPGATTASALYQAIPHRHTNRYPYDTTRPVTRATLEALDALNTDAQVRVFWMTDATMRKRLGDLMVEATHAFVADKPLVRDDDRWYRATWQELQRHRDGITLDAAGLPDYMRVLGKILPPSSPDQQHAYFVQGVENQVRTAGMLGMLAVPNKRDNTQRMQAGRLWQRMHLWATTQGLAMQPLNQLTEMADREVVLASVPHFGDALHGLVNDPAWQVLMTFRAGYATHEAFPSPRRDVAMVVLP